MNYLTSIAVGVKMVTHTIYALEQCLRRLWSGRVTSFGQQHYSKYDTSTGLKNAYASSLVLLLPLESQRPPWEEDQANLWRVRESLQLTVGLLAATGVRPFLLNLFLSSQLRPGALSSLPTESWIRIYCFKLFGFGVVWYMEKLYQTSYFSPLSSNTRDIVP